MIPDHRSRSVDELWEEIYRQSEEIKHLDDNWRSAEGSYLDAATEVEELNGQLTTVRRDYYQLWNAAQVQGVLSEIERHLLDEESPDQEATIEPESCSEAAALARDYLPNICLPKDACKDLDLLDNAPEASAWAKAAWRGFVALDTYARSADAGEGGFYQWCILV